MAIIKTPEYGIRLVVVGRMLPTFGLMIPPIDGISQELWRQW
jgi:hypothetical protein